MHSIPETGIVEGFNDVQTCVQLEDNVQRISNRTHARPERIFIRIQTNQCSVGSNFPSTTSFNLPAMENKVFYVRVFFFFSHFILKQHFIGLLT